MKKINIGLVSLAPLALLALMRPQTQNKMPIQNLKPKTQNSSLVEANNSFGVKLLQTLAKQDGKSNIVISPLSLSVALQMTYNGADGATAKAMAQALEVKNLSRTALNQENAALLALLAEPTSGVELHIANSLWTRQTLTPLPDFVQRNQSYYKATLGDLSGGADAINGWVSQQTNAKIPTIVTPADVSKSEAILANAVYFKGAWAKAFKTPDTKTEKFTPESGQAQEVPLMKQSGRFRYFENEKYQAVGLPYRQGVSAPADKIMKHASVEMTILLPRPGVKFHDFIAGLTPATFTPNAALRDGDVGLPRFKTEYSAEMKAPLSALGMGLAFDAQKANFSKMFSGGKFYIGFVKHKTYLDVNEQGTEAAAATAVGMTRMAMPRPQNPFTMIVNRPFVFAIRDIHSGAILFVGAISRP